MRTMILLSFLFLISFASGDPLFVLIVQQATRTSKGTPTQYPTDTKMNVSVSVYNPWNLNAAGGWTCGFFPGQLWYLYNITKDTNWRTLAQSYTAGIASQQYNTGTHDVGFMVYDSFGKGYEFTQNADYKTVILNAAKSLSTRYNPTVGCTQSWNNAKACKFDDVTTNFPVIIDNMMNLELLLWASQNGGDPNYYNMAVSHADQTLKNHIRADGTTFHVVDYYPNNGSVHIQCTAQGYHDNSTWARGQSWCVYGFTMVYRYTKQANHLNAAIACADQFVKHLQPDNTTLWDFDWDGATGLHYRDSSAAAVTASALFELYKYVNSTKSTTYWNTAVSILHGLNTTSYLGLYNATEGVLLHATGCYECNSEVDVSLIYADYYLTEAYQRWSLATKA